MEVKATNDHSHTVVSSVWGENYHSRFGAYTESEHVFIRKGLLDVLETNQESISVFEMGFGTGLNAFLSAIVAEKSQCAISYYAIEQYPLEKQVWSQLNYTNFVSETYRSHFSNIHSVYWNQWNDIHPLFRLYKSKGKLEELDWEKLDKFHLIYYDAFAPNAQPELWEAAVFQKMYDILAPGGLLCTYCAKGQVKRNLKTAGFEVESIPGPPGKREMTRAWKRQS